MKPNARQIFDESCLDFALKENYNFSIAKLVSSDALKNISKLLQGFPITASAFLCYEIQLGNDLPLPDFLFCVHQRNEFKKLFEKQSTHSHRFIFDEATFTGIQNLAFAWGDDNGILKNHINNIWFEFDYETLIATHPQPCFFFGPKTNSHAFEVLITMKEVFSQLYHHNIDTLTQKKLLEVYSALKDKGEITQIGMMKARGDQQLRILVQRLTTANSYDFLKKINYPYADHHELNTLMAYCYEHTSHTDIDIDILHATGDNLGLECYFKQVQDAIMFLQKLKSMEICTDANAKNLEEILFNINYSDASQFNLFFSHFKITFKPAIGFVAKAYLGYAAPEAGHLLTTKPINTISYV